MDGLNGETMALRGASVIRLHDDLDGMRCDKSYISVAPSVCPAPFLKGADSILRLEIWTGHYSGQTGILNFHIESLAEVARTISVKYEKFIPVRRWNSLIHKSIV